MLRLEDKTGLVTEGRSRCLHLLCRPVVGAEHDRARVTSAITGGEHNGVLDMCRQRGIRGPA